jgi:hypothetical protein
MSAESQMAAFYKPVGRQRFLKNLTWQPVPIHTVPVMEDSLLRGYSMYCPKYTKLKEQHRQDDDWIQLMKEKKEFLKTVQTNAGISYELDPYNIYTVSDPLFCELQHGLSWPKWCTNETFHTLQNISAFGFTKVFQGKEINKLTSGVFINQVLTDMQHKRDGKGENADKLLLVYSAHDTTLAAILSGLGVYDREIPPYASVVMIELYSQDGKYSVEVFYHKGPSADISNSPQLLPIPNCNPCSLEQFAQLMAPILLREDEFEQECSVSMANSSNKGMIAGLSVFGIVVAITLFGVAIWCSRRRRSKRAQKAFKAIENELNSE